MFCRDFILHTRFLVTHLRDAMTSGLIFKLDRVYVLTLDVAVCFLPDIHYRYAITDDAYRAMRDKNKDQCIIISGESGAGKTGEDEIKSKRPSLPPQVKTQYLYFRSHTEYFLLPWKIPEKISRRSVLFNN